MTNAEYPDGGTPPQVHTSTGQPLPTTGSPTAEVGALGGLGFLALGLIVLVAVARVGRHRG